MISLFSRQEVVKGVDYLAKENPLIIRLQNKYGDPNIVTPEGGVFLGLIKAIISQQINTKVANSIYKKFEFLYGSLAITPELVSSTSEIQLTSIGLPIRKIEYIYSVARFFVMKQYTDDHFLSMQDHVLRKELIYIKGVGDWTIDMILIFSMGRADVFPVGDFGVRRGFNVLFNKEFTPEKMLEVSKSWKPYRTIFSWYLWRIADES
tara:strand:- start:2951 stop:3571 length:621 start_codon:yes stop_codon:yes gene_type:complete